MKQRNSGKFDNLDTFFMYKEKWIIFWEVGKKRFAISGICHVLYKTSLISTEILTEI